jgi:predicted enzyme related to lactoylglutathione lyase
LAVKLSPYSVAVVVSNGKKALAFYHGKLGLDILANEDHWIVVGRKKGGMALHLCSFGGPTPKSEKGNTGILFLTDGSLEKTYQNLKKKGVKFSVPPKKMEWGWVCKFLDPDGNEIWLNTAD